MGRVARRVDLRNSVHVLRHTFFSHLGMRGAVPGPFKSWQVTRTCPQLRDTCTSVQIPGALSQCLFAMDLFRARRNIARADNQRRSWRRIVYDAFEGLLEEIVLVAGVPAKTTISGGSAKGRDIVIAAISSLSRVPVHYVDCSSLAADDVWTIGSISLEVYRMPLTRSAPDPPLHRPVVEVASNGRLDVVSFCRSRLEVVDSTREC